MYETKPYFYGTGRRKHSVARVRVYNGTGKVTINEIRTDYYTRNHIWRGYTLTVTGNGYPAIFSDCQNGCCMCFHHQFLSHISLRSL